MAKRRFDSVGGHALIFLLNREQTMAKHSYPDMSVAPKFDTVVIFTPTESMHTIELLCGGSFIHEMKAEPKEPGRHRK